MTVLGVTAVAVVGSAGTAGPGRAGPGEDVAPVTHGSLALEDAPLVPVAPVKVQAGTWYELESAFSHLFVDVAGASRDDGAAVIQWPRTGRRNQQFRFVAGTDGTYQLVARNSGKVLGILGDSKADGAEVVQQTADRRSAQRWKVQARGGSVSLVDRRSGKALDVKSYATARGIPLQQYAPAGTANQLWNLLPGGSSAPPTATPTRSATPEPSTSATPRPTGTTTAPVPTTSPPGSTPPVGAWPTATGQVKVSGTTEVTGTFDGGLKRYYGMGDGGQGEQQAALFDVAAGGTLKNVILGSPAGDGVHCLGSCTLTNVWWEDVGEDAATLKGTDPSQVMTVNGGGAAKASDKVFQHNGPGTMVVENFRASDFGKLYRSCGNCSKQYRRTVVLRNILADAPGRVLAGINSNYGDTATLTGITIAGDPQRRIVICERFVGNDSGDEPPKAGSGADGTHCRYDAADVSYR